LNSTFFNILVLVIAFILVQGTGPAAHAQEASTAQDALQLLRADGDEPSAAPEQVEAKPTSDLPAPKPPGEGPQGGSFQPVDRPILPAGQAPSGGDLPLPPPAPEPDGEKIPEARPDEPLADEPTEPEKIESPEPADQIERLPPLRPLTPPVADGDFPSLPPDPNIKREDELPPLEEELWNHGGSYLYAPEGDHLNWPDGRFGPHAEAHAAPEGCSPSDHHAHHEAHHEAHYEYLRLPEGWVGPKPFTLGPEFLGADPIQTFGAWPGCNGYVWEPRFVGYGSFRLFGFGLRENNQEQVVVGADLTLDLDLRLTGTERFHVQFRPLGREGTGGSYYQLSQPQGTVNNTTVQPDLYWFEGELGSMFGASVDPFSASDYTVTVGRFPFVLHNTFLLNDEFIGVAVNKNSLMPGPLSNLNIQMFYGFEDVDAYSDADAQLYGVHATADYHNDLYEATYAFVQHETNGSRDAHYLGLSRTQFVGNYTFAGRVLGKVGDQAGRGDGVLFVLESNYHRVFDTQPLGVEHALFYCNVFGASSGWSPIAGAGFNRIRTAFETNPLVRIAAGRPAAQTYGVAAGAHLFRLHEDESFIPEIAFESLNGEPIYGCGMRYLRKTSSRSFFEALGVLNFSENDRYERAGLFLSETIIF